MEYAKDLSNGGEQFSVGFIDCLKASSRTKGGKKGPDQPMSKFHVELPALPGWCWHNEEKLFFYLLF